MAMSVSWSHHVGPMSADAALSGVERQRRTTEALLCPTGGTGTAGTYMFQGRCYVCDADTYFYVNVPAAGNINWRETVKCGKCRMIGRARAATHVFEMEYVGGDPGMVYLTEGRGPVHRALSQRYALIGSEYFGTDAAPLGDMVDGVRNEDVQRLTFDDATFVSVLSFDVFEHIPDYLAAFGEVFRVLRSGGMFVFTVPFDMAVHKTTEKVTAGVNGKLHYLDKPEYHGDPLRPEEGSLCWRTFGWDVLDSLRSVGFAGAYGISAWSVDYGYLGPSMLTLVARK